MVCPGNFINSFTYNSIKPILSLLKDYQIDSLFLLLSQLDFSYSSPILFLDSKVLYKNFKLLSLKNQDNV